MTSRRSFLTGLAGATVALPATAQVRRPAGARDVRRLAVQFAHTGAWFRGPFKAGNDYDPAAIEEFSAVVGDYRTREVKQFDPVVLDLIWRLGAETRVGQFTCVSGYRSPATNALVGGATDSQHLAARALDLWLPEGKLGEAIDRAVAMRAGGVGAYRSWVHLDTGAVRFWDHRRPGEEGGPERESSMMTVAARPGAPRANRAVNTNLLLPAPTLPPGPTPIQGTGLGRGRQMVIMEPLELQRSGSRLPPLRVFNLGGR